MKKAKPKKQKATKAKQPSVFDSLRTRKKPDFISRITLGAHKHKPTWDRLLAASLKNWQSTNHDLLIAKAANNTSILHPDEREAAVKWECFRHLYFSGQLSDFWRNMIQKRQLDVIDEFRTSMYVAGLISWEANGFAQPWATWADDPCFPARAWLEAREKKHFKHALNVAPHPSAHVELRKDELSTWGLLFGWSKARIENQFDATQENKEEATSAMLQTAAKPLEIPCHEVPKRLHSENSTHLVVRIDWNSTKEEIKEAFFREIDPLWEARNPDGVMGRGDSELSFFKGLVLRRRLDRDYSQYEACEGLYKPLGDRKNCMPIAAKNALSLADSRLVQAKCELEQIEAKLREN